ncbi:MAG: DNA-directed RNA polymerase subunit D [Candidatus Caldarchaeum sp.]|nr:DNA-directed RNA polymerase subunit D [Candidatus Caldarchaeum sp.]
MKIISEDAESITLDVTDIPQPLANALRRVIIKEVPTMAVEEVLIIENSSVMTNEVLAHRISLIPFITDLENFNIAEECKCQSRLGCEKCVVRFVLRAEALNEPVTVYSRDIKPERTGISVAPFSGDIPVVALAPGQKVELELYVRLGRGRKHTKWMAGIATLYEENNRRYFYVESFGFLPPRRMVLEAAKIVKTKIREIEEGLKELMKYESANAG